MDDQAPPGESKPPPGTAAAGEPTGSADQRIQAIIQAAEQAAAGIIEDADAQARRYIDTSRQKADDLADERVRVMSSLTETLVRQAELVRRQSDELLSALDSARDELAGHLGKELTPGAPPPASLTPPAIAAEPKQAAEPVAEPEPPTKPVVERAAPAEPAQPEAPASTPPPGGSRVPHLQPVESKPPGLHSVEAAPESAPTVEEAKPQAAPEPPKAEPPQAEPPRSEPPSTPPPGAAPPTAAPPASAPPASAPPGPSQSGAPSTPGGQPSDGARLLAAQMAVAGSSREEIEARLRKEFNIEDAGPILDGILGPS